MAYQLTYKRDTYKPSNKVIPGNETDSNPVEFDLAPAEGPDLARIKSLLIATSGIVGNVNWSPEAQDAVIKAFETGGPAFVNTIERVRGFTVPAAMAKRAGLILDMPTHVPEGKTAPEPNFNAPIAIVTGLDFSRVCGFCPVLGMMVAGEIVKLTQKTEVDTRFFELPGGSGGPGISPASPSTAADASQPPGRPGTAERTKKRKGVLIRNPPDGTSHPSQ